MQMDADRDELGYGGDYDVPDYDAPDEDTWDLGDSRAYWRRRFLILCGGVVALGVCAWLLPGAHGSSSQPTAAASASMAALARQQTLPPAATGSAWVPPSPTPQPTPSASPAKLAATAEAATAANGKVSLSYKPRASGSATAAAPACAPADIVLSLFTSQPSYAAGEQPKFSVYAVSTSSSACTMSYGPGSVQVVVTSHGQVVWDSAACKATAAKSVRFTLGVPQVLMVSWNRKASGPAGCAGALPAGTGGTFDAVAMRGGQSGQSGQSSPVAAFKLTK